MSPMMMFVLAGVGTYAIRISAIALVGRGVTISPSTEATLRLIAPSVLAAIVADTLILDGDGFNTDWRWYIAAGAAVVVSLRWRSAGLTMVGGLVSLWVLLAVF